MIEFKARGQSRYYVFVNVASPPAPWQLTDPALALPAVAGGPPKYHTQAHKEPDGYLSGSGADTDALREAE